MSLTHGFFYSTSSDPRLYGAEQFAAYFARFIQSGVFNVDGGALLVSANGDMTVDVAPGAAFLLGYWMEIDGAPETLTIAQNTGSATRTARIKARLDTGSRTVSLTVDYTAAAPTRTSTVYELVLADVLQPVGQTAISADQITDRRADSTLCGAVNWMVRGDYNADFTAYWANVSDQWYDWIENVIRQAGDDPETALATIAAELENLTPVDLSLTLTASGWAYDSTDATWEQTVAVQSLSLTSDSKCYVDVDMSGATGATGDALQSEWSLVGRVYTDAQGVHAVCYGDAPASNIPIIVRVIQKR